MPDFWALALPRQLARMDGEFLAVCSLAAGISCDSRRYNASVLELTFDGYVSSPYKRSFFDQYSLDLETNRILRRRQEFPSDLADFRSIGVGSDNLVESYRKKSADFARIFDISTLYQRVLAANLASSKDPISEIVVSIDDRICKYQFDKQSRKYCNLKSQKSLLIDEVYSLAVAGKARTSSSWNYQNLFFLIPGILCPNFTLCVTPFEFDDEIIFGNSKKGIERAFEVAGVYPKILPFIPPSLVSTEYSPKAISKCRNLDYLELVANLPDGFDYPGDSSSTLNAGILSARFGFDPGSSVFDPLVLSVYLGAWLNWYVAQDCVKIVQNRGEK